jgi:hypothetical protein
MNENNELNFLKKKSSISKLKSEIEKSTLLTDTDAKSTKFESDRGKDKVIIF